MKFIAYANSLMTIHSKTSIINILYYVHNRYYRFYIGCEKCTDWFHGRCVGILQAEAENIEEYVCPKCEPNSRLNYPNLKKLNMKDHDLIKKTFKTIQVNI